MDILINKLPSSSSEAEGEMAVEEKESVPIVLEALEVDFSENKVVVFVPEIEVYLLTLIITTLLRFNLNNEAAYGSRLLLLLLLLFFKDFIVVVFVLIVVLLVL